MLVVDVRGLALRCGQCKWGIGDSPLRGPAGGLSGWRVRCHTGAVLVTLLGPVAAEAGGVSLRLGGVKQRAVFALLASNANRVVSLDRLVDELWRDEPPAGATQVLQSYVSRLRRLLADVPASAGLAPQILTRPPGWVLTMPAEDVDVTRFVTSLTEARRLLDTAQPQDAAEGVRLLQAGLALWTGEALCDLTSLQFARDEATRLAELRLAASELLLEAMLVLGQHDTAAEQARGFVTTSPFRERGWCALMVALYRAGRQSEALAAAAELRGILADELGLDPSPRVVEIEQRILVQDPTLFSPRTTNDWPVEDAPGPRPVRSEPPAYSAQPLVGRDDAIRAVDTAVADAARGCGCVLVLQAPAGFGKSTMMRVLADKVGAQGAVVNASGVGPGPTPALWPWVAIVRQLAALQPDIAAADSGAAKSELIAATLALMQPGRPAQHEDPAGHDSALDRTSLYRGILDLLCQARSRRPLAVLIDDAQWVDADSLTLLALAVDELAPAGVLFTVAIRSDEPGSADVAGMLARIGRESIVKIRLPALAAGEVAELVSALSGVDVEPGTSRAIHSRTGGSPLFASELIRLLTSERNLTAEGVAGALPEEVREVVRRRLERLPAQTVAVLMVAAVASRATDVDLLAKVTGLDAEAVVDACEPALVAGLLHEDPDRFDGFILSHDLVRQTLEESMPSARRTRMHAKVAAALQSRPEPSPQQVADIAHHLTVAAPVVGAAAAIPYLIAASEDALTRFANDLAEQHLRTALDLAAHIDDPDTRTDLERRVRGRLTALLVYAGGTMPDSPEAGLSVPVMVDADSAAAWLGTTLMTCVGGHYGLAIETAEQALARNPPPVGAVAALFVLGWASYVVGRADGADRAFAAMEQLIETGPDTDIAGALSVVSVAGAGHEALVAHILGDEAEADRHLGVAKARAADAPISLINVELSSCWLACMRGDTARTRVHAAACAEMADRLHYPLFALQAAIMGGWADAMCGDTAGAARADAAYADFVATGIRLFLPLYLLLRAEAHEALRDSPVAADLVREARVVSAEIGDVCLSPRLTEFSETLVPLRG